MFYNGPFSTLQKLGICGSLRYPQVSNLCISICDLHWAIDDASRMAVSGSWDLTLDVRDGPLERGWVEAVQRAARVVIVPPTELNLLKLLFWVTCNPGKSWYISAHICWLNTKGEWMDSILWGKHANWKCFSAVVQIFFVYLSSLYLDLLLNTDHKWIVL